MSGENPATEVLGSLIGLAIIGGFFYYMWWPSNKAREETPAPTTKQRTMVNIGRKLSEAESKFALLGKSLGPSEMPCDQVSEGKAEYQEPDHCWADQLTYEFSADHTVVARISREEWLSEKLSFGDVVAMLTKKYGPPSSAPTPNFCFAAWGDSDHISLSVMTVKDNCGYPAERPEIRYVLDDQVEMQKAKSAKRAQAEAERQNELANHKL